MWRCIIGEMEQREGERRQELAEKAVTRVLLMCNESLHPGERDERKDRRTEGRRDRDEKQRGREGMRL